MMTSLNRDIFHIPDVDFLPLNFDDLQSQNPSEQGPKEPTVVAADNQYEEEDAATQTQQQQFFALG